MKNHNRPNRGSSGRSSKATPLKEAMKNMFEEFKLDGKLDEMKLISSWENMMGKTIASRTSKIYIKDKTLFVQISSAPLKNELVASKVKILEIFKKEAGKSIIEDIRFL